MECLYRYILKCRLNSGYNSQVTRYEVRSTRYEVRSTKYEVRSTRYEVRGTKYEVRSTNEEQPAHGPITVLNRLKNSIDRREIGEVTWRVALLIPYFVTDDTLRSFVIRTSYFVLNPAVVLQELKLFYYQLCRQTLYLRHP